MLSAIGMHVYAGGFTVGVREHFDVMAHLEHAAYGAEVVRLNFPDLPIHAGGPANWPARWPRRPRFVYANPPCAIWSGAGVGARGRWAGDPRLQAHHDIFSYAVDTADADVIAVESVPRSFTEGRRHVDGLVDRARATGRSTTVVMHDARHLGVAQRRSRIFYVFSRVEIPWETPDAGDAPTVREVFRGLPRRTRGFEPRAGIPRLDMPLLLQAAPGEIFRQVYDRLHPDPPRGHRGQKIGSPSFLDRRIPWDKPAPVIIANKLYHPEEDRRLTLEELVALSSFPQDYRWPPGDSATISGWISRGVMPRVGEWLAGNVRRALERNRRINDPGASVLDLRTPPGRTFTMEEWDMKIAQLRPTGKTTVPAAKAGPAARPPDVVAGEGSGAYIRRCLAAGFGDDEILASVHASFPGSKAKKSDISWNKGKLRKEGVPFDGSRSARSRPANGHAPADGAPVKAARVKPDGAPVVATRTRGDELGRIGRALQDIGAALAAMGDGQR